MSGSDEVWSESESWFRLNPNDHVRNTFVDIRADAKGTSGVTKSDSDMLSAVAKVSRSESPVSRSSAGPALSYEAPSVNAVKEIEGSAVPHQKALAVDSEGEPCGSGTAKRRSRPGRMERQRKKENAEGFTARLARLIAVFRTTIGQSLNGLYKDTAVFRTTVGQSLKGIYKDTIGRITCCSVLMMITVIILLSIVAIKHTNIAHFAIKDPSTTMVEHSVSLLTRSDGTDVASISTLQNKLQLKKMSIDLDTQVLTGTRAVVKELISSGCSLPDNICKSMSKAIDLKGAKYHKKTSVPLDSNKGSYFGVWMWVQETGNDDEVQVAYKAGSLSYHLRDIVTYKDKVEEDPVYECESKQYVFSSERTCRSMGTKKTVTSMPVFTQTIMSPDEMQLVDTMMEGMLAQKVIENADAANKLSNRVSSGRHVDA